MADIGIIMKSFGLNHHTFSNNVKIYSSCYPGECHMADIGIIMKSFGLNHHTFANNVNIYPSCYTGEYAFLKVKVIDSILTSGRHLIN